jgi:hypothetical protein
MIESGADARMEPGPIALGVIASLFELLMPVPALANSET